MKNLSKGLKDREMPTRVAKQHVKRKRTLTWKLAWASFGDKSPALFTDWVIRKPFITVIIFLGFHWCCNASDCGSQVRLESKTLAMARWELSEVIDEWIKMVLATFLNPLFFVMVEKLVSNLSTLCFAGYRCISFSCFAFFPVRSVSELGGPEYTPLLLSLSSTTLCSLSHQEGQAAGGQSVFWNEPYCLSLVSDRLKQLSVLLRFQCPLTALFSWGKVTCVGYIEKIKFLKRSGLWMLIFT